MTIKEATAVLRAHYIDALREDVEKVIRRHRRKVLCMLLRRAREGNRR